MDKEYRREILETLPASVRKRTVLGEIDREYTLSEIVTITRAAPAKTLGLSQKGHLGIGADADVAIFHPEDDGARTPKCSSKIPCRRTLDFPRWVLKAGKVIVKDGNIVDEAFTDTCGKTVHVAPGFDRTIEEPLKEHFRRYYTVSYENYPVQDCYLPKGEKVPCR
jgi:formylmethanofuran dehydrogenase subunit A